MTLLPTRGAGFTTILGAELHEPATSLGDPWHILAVGRPRDFAPPTAEETGPRLAARAKAAGAYVAAAHPAWYDLTDQDVLSVTVPSSPAHDAGSSVAAPSATSDHTGVGYPPCPVGCLVKPPFARR